MMKHKHYKRTAGFEDIFVWPSGKWCFIYEKDKFAHMSDDYAIVVFVTKEYDEFFQSDK